MNMFTDVHATQYSASCQRVLLLEMHFYIGRGRRVGRGGRGEGGREGGWKKGDVEGEWKGGRN